ncbi:MAG: hypothetical protein FD131_1051 [Rhodocyclaceae bacterium]|nr:MAG: hypothetical protein FD131_1051 [Rhodocyclaceae bacterium]
MWQSGVFLNQPSKERTMALEFNISAPFRFSMLASAGHLSMFWGWAERGFVLESGAGANPSGKIIEVWRNAYCGSLNVSAFGLHLVIAGSKRATPASATA